MEIYTAQNLKKTYQSGEELVHALNDVSLNIKKGAITSILGPSGSGKTTLLNVLAGVDQVDSGSIIFENGVDITKLNNNQLTDFRRNHIGFVFQSYNLISNLTVKDNILLGEDLSSKPLNVNEVIEKVGLTGLTNKMTYQLSGGQQQRVAIARILVKNPEIIVCDEPTGALDEKTGKSILRLLKDLNEEFKTTIIMVTHNPGIAQMSDYVFKFKNGIIEEKIHNEIKTEPENISWS